MYHHVCLEILLPPGFIVAFSALEGLIVRVHAAVPHHLVEIGAPCIAHGAVVRLLHVSVIRLMYLHVNLSLFDAYHSPVTDLTRELLLSPQLLLPLPILYAVLILQVHLQVQPRETDE